MDDALLCKDMLGLIFSFLPEMYSVFVRLCRGAKGVLRLANIDGWDALMAQGCTVEITRNMITWFKNGKYHRGGGLPAMIYYSNDCTSYGWFINGEMHREDGPAAIKMRHNEPIFNEYVVHGERYRKDGPAYISKTSKTAWWYQGDVKRREGDLPAEIGSSERYRYVRWYTGDNMSRVHGPASIQVFDRYIVETYIQNGFSQSERTHLLGTKKYDECLAEYKKHLIDYENAINGMVGYNV